MNPLADDTIAAISTAPGEAGIAIVRVSGPAAPVIADRVFRCPAPPPSQRPASSFVHGFVRGEDGADADEALLLLFRAPRSYTREDAAEFQCHGGRICAARVLRAVLAAGARMAEPGEFTQRAFLHGRLDLVEAEAVADLIRAKTDRAAAAALEQLEGRLSETLNACYNELMEACARVEASLDFDEDDVPASVTDGLSDTLTGVRTRFHDLLASWREGRLLREGALVVIAGRPNAGKSTLMNRLLGYERAIVTDVPGTTRDTIEESFAVEGIPIRLVDTAGLRETDCRVEQAGVARAVERLNAADLVLYVVDRSLPPNPDDTARLAAMRPGRLLVVLNKSDLGRLTDAEAVAPRHAVEAALTAGTGVEEIRRAIAEALHVAGDAPPHAVISARHRAQVEAALRALDRAITLLGESEPQSVLAASELRAAAEAVGRIVGRVYSEDLLNEVFSRFCVGK
jgi:tRNA modification GTPase